MEQYFSIGKCIATHGLTGELVLKHSLGKKTSLKGLSVLFIQEKKGNHLPWFVAAAREKNEEEVFVKLEGVTTKEAARLLVQKEVWLTEADFKKQVAKTAAISLLGFAIVEAGTTLGVVEEVIEQPHQILCRITMDGKEVYIPLHQETIQSIDTKNKRVQVQLPEGLLDIYLS